MNDFQIFISYASNLFKAIGMTISALLKVLIWILKFFLIVPFYPIIDLGKEYLGIIQKNIKELGWKKLLSVDTDYSRELVRYSLSFLFLVGIIGYSVVSTPYGFYTDYILEKKKQEFSDGIIESYKTDPYGFKEKYSKEVYEWFNQYNNARNNRNCEFMKIVSVDLLQWEKNTLQFKDKYLEENVLRSDYVCDTYDKINEKGYLLPVAVSNIDIIEIDNGKDKIIKVVGYLAHAKINENTFIGLSKRKFTLWKLDTWTTWRIYSIDNVE